MHSADTRAGAVTVGAVVSTTVTVCVAVAKLPLASVAVQVTVVAPRENNAGASFVITGAVSQISVAVAVPIAITCPVVPVHSADTGAGAVTVGNPTSFTVTSKVSTEVLPEASIAVQVTRFVPRVKFDPDTGTQDTVAPGQLSVTVGSVQVTIASQAVPEAKASISRIVSITGDSRSGILQLDIIVQLTGAEPTPFEVPTNK